MKLLGIERYTPGDIKKAQKYWHATFLHHAQQLPEKKEKCQVSIIVPVFGERLNRIKAQLASFERQTLSRQSFEVIYIVNNGFSDGTSEWEHVYAQNQTVITFLSKYTRICVRVIDRSSPGKEIRDCNVGKARNIALAETSVRYFLKGEDGILFQTDADVRLNNKRHLQDILSVFRKDPKSMGAAGGVLYEFSPDVESIKKKEEYTRLFHDVVLYFRWQTLLSAFRKKHLVIPAFATQFSGMHMISRSLASACIGGVQGLGKAEDVFFGDALKKFADEHGCHTLPMRDRWYVVSAFRESFRTEASFGKVFQRILKEGGVYAASEKYPDFQTFAVGLLKKIGLTEDISTVRHIVRDSEKPYRYSDADLREFLRVVRSAEGSRARFSAYIKWREVKQNKDKKILGEAYLQYFPAVRITRYRYEKLKRIVYKDKHKRFYVESIKKNFQNFRRERK